MTTFGLDALDARKGDALVLRWGTDDHGWVGLIDGGPDAVYDRAIRPHLISLAGTDPAGQVQQVALELVVVSHVDDDHINGIIDLANAIDVAQKQALSIPAAITEVWHNAFADLEFLPEFADEPRLQDAIHTADANPSALRAQAEPRENPTIDDITAGAESVAQGRTLDRLLKTINVPRNAAFGDRGGFVREGAAVDVKGLTIRVIAPDDQLLKKLKVQWKCELEKILRAEAESEQSRVAALAAAFDDKSVPNQSSIVLLIEFAGRSMLLTGDARGDHILEALNRSQDLTSPLEVDLFKLPHHGSAHSNGPELFEAIRARHYVVSGNGEHGNPHPDTLKALFSTQQRPITLSLTNRPIVGAVKPDDVERAQEAQAVLDEAAERPDITIRYRDEDEPSISVDLV